MQKLTKIEIECIISELNIRTEYLKNQSAKEKSNTSSVLMNLRLEQLVFIADKLQDAISESNMQIEIVY